MFPFTHNGVLLFSVYVLGDIIVQLRRPSLPNVQTGVPVTEGPGYVPFGRVSNAGAANGGEDSCKVLPEDEQNVPAPTEELLRALANEIKARLDLKVFGMDLIRDTKTGDYLIIDINYLPGYYGVPNVFENLLELMYKHVQSAKK